MAEMKIKVLDMPLLQSKLARMRKILKKRAWYQRARTNKYVAK